MFTIDVKTDVKVAMTKQWFCHIIFSFKNSSDFILKLINSLDSTPLDLLIV